MCFDECVRREAERHVTEGAALAQAIGRPYIEVACRAYQAFPSKSVSLGNARERGRHALALAERYGLSDRPVLAPALGAVAGMTMWIGEFEEGERWLRRGWKVLQPDIDPASAVLLHMVTGMLHAGHGEHQSALEALTAAVRAQSLLTGVHILAPVIAEWLVATQVRLGMPAEARATLDGFSTEHERMDGIVLARAVISLAEGDPATALAELLLEVRHKKRPPTKVRVFRTTPSRRAVCTVPLAPRRRLASIWCAKPSAWAFHAPRATSA